MKKVTVAQIGVGYWGPNLLRNLVLNSNCEVKSVVDVSRERCEFTARLHPKVTLFQDVKDVLDDPQIQAVVIATPVKTHFSLTMQALKKGKHVLVEKPMATSVDEIDEIASYAKQHNLVAMVGHTFLYNSAVRYLKQLIKKGDLGDIRYIYCQRLSLGRIRSDVNALWNFAPHDVSIVQYLLDDLKPISVVKRGMDYVQTGIEDVVFMDIVYSNKVLVHIHVSWLDPHKVRRITVVGSKKMVVYDDVSDKKIAVYDKGVDRMAVLGENMDFDKAGPVQFNYRSGEINYPEIEWTEPLKVEIDHFIDCIVNGTSCLTGPEHARKVVEILSR